MRFLSFPYYSHSTMNTGNNKNKQDDSFLLKNMYYYQVNV